MTDYDSFLELLNKYAQLFQRLIETQHKKMEAMKVHSTEQLNECMKQEQADTLLLRGYDKKRLEMQHKLSLGDIQFSHMLPLIPDERQAEFNQMFKQLGSVYESYKASANCAKETIELNIYRLGSAIEELKSKNNTASGDVYSPDGSVSSDTITFKDMKI